MTRPETSRAGQHGSWPARSRRGGGGLVRRGWVSAYYYYYYYYYRPC
ncbi:MAG TPA: hypothetical protein VHR39_09070 [Propionibacteriaceae bacterium]|nr:hypothetical protein [Propionibacteriaceae bacterium]